MATPNQLVSAPPYAVEKALKRLGADLRIARVRRAMTVEDVARKIGTGRRAVLDAEKGKPSTGVAVYVALLWAFDLLAQLDPVADPTLDAEGQALARTRDRQRVRRSKVADNDF